MSYTLSKAQADSLVSRCSESNALNPPFDRHVHQVDEFIILVNNTQSGYDGYIPDTCVSDKNANALAAMRLVSHFIPVADVLFVFPKLDILIQRRVRGVTLDKVMKDMTEEQRAASILLVADLVCKLSQHTNGTSPQTVSGTRPIFHDLAEEHLNLTPANLRNQPCVLSHLDLSPSNIIMTDDCSKVAALIDWEFAAYVPLETAAYVHQKCNGHHGSAWANLFDVVKVMLGSQS